MFCSIAPPIGVEARELGQRRAVELLGRQQPKFALERDEVVDLLAALLDLVGEAGCRSGTCLEGVARLDAQGRGRGSHQACSGLRLWASSGSFSGITCPAPVAYA
jgi:hypothetical protein